MKETTAPAPRLRLELQQQPREVLTVAEAIHFARSAADEAYKAARESGSSHVAAHETATTAYRCNMPELQNAASVKAYMGAAIQGLQLGYINAREARLLLWGAGLWLQLEREGEVAA